MLATVGNTTASLGHTGGFLTQAFMINSSFYLGTVGTSRDRRYSFDSFSSYILALNDTNKIKK